MTTKGRTREAARLARLSVFTVVAARPPREALHRSTRTHATPEAALVSAPWVAAGR